MVLRLRPMPNQLYCMTQLRTWNSLSCHVMICRQRYSLTSQNTCTILCSILDLTNNRFHFIHLFILLAGLPWRCPGLYNFKILCVCLPPPVHPNILYPSTTCPWFLSSTYLQSFSSVSWKLCEYIETDRHTILFIDIDYHVNNNKGHSIYLVWIQHDIAHCHLSYTWRLDEWKKMNSIIIEI